MDGGELNWGKAAWHMQLILPNLGVLASNQIIRLQSWGDWSIRWVCGSVTLDVKTDCGCDIPLGAPTVIITESV